MTLEESIKYHAQMTPDKPAAVCGKDSITYSELWKAIESKAQALADEGLMPDRPYVFRATQDLEFLKIYCAIHHAGAIAVPLENKVPAARQ